MGDGAANRFSRRALSVPAVVALATALTITLPVWSAGTAVVDVVRGRWRLPTTRLLAFALCWAWLETTGALATLGLWLGRRTGDTTVHYALQRWWAGRLMAALRTTCAVTVSVEGSAALRPGPALVLIRHASLADSLVATHVVISAGGLRPRVVLKRELLADPCLDIVGNRLPNHFVDRGADDSAAEIAAIEQLARGLGPDDCCVIFPEGTRFTPAKQARALAAIDRHDPERSRCLVGLRHVLPPRRGGAAALVRAAPDADVVVAWHVGFEGMATFRGCLRRIAAGPVAVRVVLRRVPAADVPRGDAFGSWLDAEWMQIDRDIDGTLAAVETVN